MKEKTQSDLIKLTNELLELNQYAENYYINIVKKEEGYEPDFFGTVKPFADQMKEKREQWLPLALKFVQEKKPLHLHPVQLTQTEDNLEVVAIKSFYKDSSQKRQMETYKSVRYVLNQLLQSLSN